MRVLDCITKSVGIFLAIIAGDTDKMSSVQEHIDHPVIRIDIVSQRTDFILGILLEDDRTYVVPNIFDDIQICIGIVYTALRQ